MEIFFPLFNKVKSRKTLQTLKERKQTDKSATKKRMPGTGLLDAKSCQLCLGDPCLCVLYLADRTRLITAAAKSSVEEDGWQGTRGRQWRPGCFKVRKS